MIDTKTPDQWFTLAKRAYVDQHQGCAWCGGSHRVHATHSATQQIYQCQRCDFQVSFDLRTQRCKMIPGEDLSLVMDTMVEQPMANVS